MKSFCFILCLFIQVFPVKQCIAQLSLRQQEDQIKVLLGLQKEKIDSLNKASFKANDTTRVNCFNLLSQEYYIFNTDSAWLYASNAYQLAQNLNYRNGMAAGLLNLAQITQERGPVSEAEKYFRQVPEIFEEDPHSKEYIHAIGRLGYNLLLQLRFEEARFIFEKELAYYKSINDLENEARAYRHIGKSYDAQGYFEKAAEYLRKDMEITRKLPEGGSRRRYMCNYNLANLYKDAGDKQTAIVDYQLSANRALENKLPDII